jgi:hypothetical protein
MEIRRQRQRPGILKKARRITDIESQGTQTCCPVIDHFGARSIELNNCSEGELFRRPNQCLEFIAGDVP